MRAPSPAPLLCALLLAAGCGAPAVDPAPLRGVWHAVAPGETIEAIARAHGADPDEVAELNDLPRGAPVAGREEVFVPTAKGGAAPGTGAAPRPAAVAPAAACGGGRPCLAWPARGEIAAAFGARDGDGHDGIDILAPAGADVVAAEAGRVIYSGDGIAGYGNMILIRHPNGLITVYAHNAENAVRDGDEVARGQKVATVGSSGSATVPHLHFEVREGETPRDPLLYLPEEGKGP